MKLRYWKLTRLKLFSNERLYCIISYHRFDDFKQPVFCFLLSEKLGAGKDEMQTFNKQPIKRNTACIQVICTCAKDKWYWYFLKYTTFSISNYLDTWQSPDSVKRVKVSKEITCKWQNQRSETNKYVSWAYFWSCKQQGSTLKNC